MKKITVLSAIFSSVLCNASFADDISTTEWKIPAEKTAVAATSLQKLNALETLAVPGSGQLTVLHFWATWCPPCIEELPQIDRLAAELQSKGIAVEAVSEDRGGANDVNAFFSRHETTPHMPQLLDPKRALARSLGINSLPVTVLINADGQEIARLVGNG